MDSSVPLLTPFTSYLKWKLKMIAYLKRWGLHEVSIGLGKESYENENDWLNDSDRAYGAICLTLFDNLYYLIDSAEYPKEVWTILDITFGKHNEDHNSTLEIISSTTRVLHSKLSSSTLSDEVVQDEDEAKSSTHSIWIEESLHAVTPSPMLRKFMRYLISHLLILLKQKKTFESLILKKNTAALPCKHSPVIFLWIMCKTYQ